MNAIEIKNLRKSLGNFSLKIDDLKEIGRASCRERV